MGRLTTMTKGAISKRVRRIRAGGGRLCSAMVRRKTMSTEEVGRRERTGRGLPLPVGGARQSTNSGVGAVKRCHHGGCSSGLPLRLLVRSREGIGAGNNSENGGGCDSHLKRPRSGGGRSHDAKWARVPAVPPVRAMREVGGGADKRARAVSDSEGRTAVAVTVSDWAGPREKMRGSAGFREEK
jgi:hypothetical protein